MSEYDKLTARLLGPAEPEVSCERPVEVAMVPMLEATGVRCQPVSGRDTMRGWSP